MAAEKVDLAATGEATEEAIEASAVTGEEEAVEVSVEIEVVTGGAAVEVMAETEVVIGGVVVEVSVETGEVAVVVALEETEVVTGEVVLARGERLAWRSNSSFRLDTITRTMLLRALPRVTLLCTLYIPGPGGCYDKSRTWLHRAAFSFYGRQRVLRSYLLYTSPI